MIILGSLESAKARSRLPIGVNSTFFARCYVWGATSEYRFKIGDFAPTGPGWPKSLSIGGLPINHFSQKTRLNHLSDGIEIWTDLSSVLSQYTRLTETRTDRISSPNRVCIPCSAVENHSLGLQYHPQYGPYSMLLCYVAIEGRCIKEIILLSVLDFF